MQREVRSEEFAGAKMALLNRGRVATILRDDRPDILYPAHWDLPGGGREAGETPIETALRELHEELSISLHVDRPHWTLRTRNSIGGRVWFFVADLADNDLNAIRLGDEGQTWTMMPVPEFIAHDRAVPYLAERLARYTARENRVR